MSLIKLPKVSYERTEAMICPDCGGSGKVGCAGWIHDKACGCGGTGWEVCIRCGSSGEISEPDADTSSKVWLSDCSTCDGTGYLDNDMRDPCPECNPRRG